MRFNVGDRFVEFYDGDPEGVPFTVTRIPDGPRFYAETTKWVGVMGEDAFEKHDDGSHLVAPCAECEGVCLTLYANEKVYKCEECGNEWD